MPGCPFSAGTGSRREPLNILGQPRREACFPSWPPVFHSSKCTDGLCWALGWGQGMHGEREAPEGPGQGPAGHLQQGLERLLTGQLQTTFNPYLGGRGVSGESPLCEQEGEEVESLLSRPDLGHVSHLQRWLALLIWGLGQMETSHTSCEDELGSVRGRRGP